MEARAQPARRIRAAVTREFGGPMTVEQLDLRAPAPGEVGVRVTACAICHSDISYMNGAWGGHLPGVFGHEVAGIVDEVGEGLDEVAAGDSVVVTLIRWCGRCPTCAAGLPALCENRSRLSDLSRSPLTLDGEPVHQGLRCAGFAERVVVHSSQVVRVPDRIPSEQAALLACGVITGVGAVLHSSGSRTGATAAVVGLGGVGLNAVQGCVLAGSPLILGVDPVAGKRRFATTLGATHTAEPADALGQTLELTGGRGLDLVVVTAPSAAAVEGAVAMLADAGTAVLVGLPSGTTVTLDPEAIAERGQRIVGSKVGSARPHADIPHLAGLNLAGRLQLEPLVTHRFGLDEINDAIATARAGEALRVVVVP
ncbi:MAG TPA: alcohol dehydrogenase catalytic domain-containing protein [Gaiellales bacterium]|nr:alcohol dehydrogenase catalytic domain-containing protein [Gaiellales bacterium]